MKCLRLGEQVGHYLKTCCNGGVTEVPLYSCQSPQQRADYCMLSHGESGLAPIRLTGEEQRVAQVACCTTCTFREQTVSLQRVDLTPDQNRGVAYRIWKSRRDARMPEAHIRKVVVYDCDRTGIGDALMQSWVAEGTKGNRSRLLLRASGQCAKLLTALGQELTTIPATSSFNGVYHAASGARPPTIVVRARQLGFNVDPVRPSFTPDAEAERYLDESNIQADVLVCPQCNDSRRAWDRKKYLAVVERLTESGLRVVVSGVPDNYFSKLPHWQPLTWMQMASLMRRVKLVIGNDSGPMHLAGTLNVPALALLGWAGEEMFSLYGSVESMWVPKRIMPCVGCWLRGVPGDSDKWGYSERRCSRSCEALQALTVDEVTEKSLSLLNGRNRTWQSA